MLNKEPKGFITAEIAVASTSTGAVSAHKSSSPFVGSNPTDEDRGRVSIVTPDHGSSAADHLAELVSSSMPDATDAVIRGFDCTPSEDGCGTLFLQQSATLALTPAGSSFASVTHPRAAYFRS